MATIADWSSGRSSPRNARAADLASASLGPDMLKLRSSATATDSGNSPDVKLVIVWSAPFSRSSKSSCFSVVTG